MNTLPKKFREPFEALGIDRSSAVLVALSGGADSTALLYAMHLCRQKYPFRLCAAHVNHNIRTEKYNNEALRDENFCKDLCKQLGVELFIKSVDIPTLSQELGKSTETVARRVRYDFFAEIMREQNVKVLLTAHNANDNLETQIFNLCRGCGIRGMSGIPRTRNFEEGNGVIFRPLIDVTKSEVLEFCKDNSLPFVTDSTNFEYEYTRNRIRNKIIPELQSIFGDPLASSSRLSTSADEDDDYICKCAEEIFDKFTDKKITLDVFNSLHVSLKRRIILLGYSRISNATLETVHINGIISLAAKSIPHSSVSLPNLVDAKIEDGCLIFSPRKENEVFDYHLQLADGFNVIPNTEFAVVIEHNKPQNKVAERNGQIYKLYTSAQIKNDKMLPLFARPRQEGDAIRTNGMTKKVKKLLCDKKIPLDERNRLPIIVDSNGQILYVPKCAVVNDDNNGNSKFDILIYKTERTTL